MVFLSNGQHSDTNMFTSNSHDGAAQKFIVRRYQDATEHFDLVLRAIQFRRSQVHERRPEQMCMRQQRSEIAVARYQGSPLLRGPR